MNLSKGDELLVNAYLDGELPPIEADSLRAAASVRASRSPPRSRPIGCSERRCAPISMKISRRAICEAAFSRSSISPPRRKHVSWGSLAASFLAGAVLAGGLTFGALNHQTGDDLASEVVSAHIRGLMAPAPADVASSDHHTVKPWFNGKLAFAPVVPDLGAQGYPLLGGRIDVIGLEPAASLVYSRGKHLISVTELPTSKARPWATVSFSERGYLAVSWSDGGVTYFAVSDAAGEELENFVKLFKAAAATGGAPS